MFVQTPFSQKLLQSYRYYARKIKGKGNTKNIKIKKTFFIQYKD